MTNPYRVMIGNRDLLKGKDVIGVAATGNGKTLAFLLPAFADVLAKNHRADRQAPGFLVMPPTRELAQQIEDEANRFGRAIGMHSVSIYGGAPKRDQISSTATSPSASYRSSSGSGST